jgi:hypothetical protein
MFFLFGRKFREFWETLFRFARSVVGLFRLHGAAEGRVMSPGENGESLK